MRSEKLTEEMVQQAGPIEGTTLYRLPDGDEDKYGNGLFLFRWWTGKKTWKIRYAINGKKYWFVLGTYPLLSLEEARNMAADAFRNVKAGVHPESIRKREEEERKNRLILDMGILPLLENTALFYTLQRWRPVHTYPTFLALRDGFLVCGSRLLYTWPSGYQSIRTRCTCQQTEARLEKRSRLQIDEN